MVEPVGTRIRSETTLAHWATLRLCSAQLHTSWPVSVLQLVRLLTFECIWKFYGVIRGRLKVHMPPISCVVIAARRLEPLQKVQSEIQSYGGKCDVVHPLNIREADQCYAAVKTILERHKRLDGLVNNAGGQFASPADQISPNGFKSVIDLNLNGTFYMMRAAYDLYMKTHGGSIVTVLAMYENGWYYVSHSAAARAAVANLNVTLAQEWTPKSGVRLNAVVPGAILGAGQSNYPPMVQKIVREVRHSGPHISLGLADVSPSLTLKAMELRKSVG